MKPEDIARAAAKALDSKKGVDIKVLSISDLTVVADYFVICTGTSNTHLKTLSDACEETLPKLGAPCHHIEGRHGGTWVLLDFSGVVVHLFTGETREFYSLERLWADAKPIDWSDEK